MIVILILNRWVLIGRGRRGAQRRRADGIINFTVTTSVSTNIRRFRQTRISVAI
jgi:hypothetical protein